jgi:hypothetical protein
MDCNEERIMDVEYKQIQSSSPPDNNRPWYELSASNGTVVIETDGGTDVELGGRSVDVETSADSVVAVSADGELVTCLSGERRDLRAHLGWYDADTETLTLLESVEN